MNSKKGVAGVDEAGRGALAGPVIAAAVILDDSNEIPGLDDSKKLSEKKREYLADRIREQARSWSVARVEHKEIDPTRQHLQALEKLGVCPVHRCSYAPVRPYL